MLSQGFRKYLSHAKDHEELLAFILGQMVKDKVRSTKQGRGHDRGVGDTGRRYLVLAFDATCGLIAGKRSRDIRFGTFLSFKTLIDERIQVASWR
jgi:hypothetical protein